LERLDSRNIWDNRRHVSNTHHKNKMTVNYSGNSHGSQKILTVVIQELELSFWNKKNRKVSLVNRKFPIGLIVIDCCRTRYFTKLGKFMTLVRQ